MIKNGLLLYFNILIFVKLEQEIETLMRLQSDKKEELKVRTEKDSRAVDKTQEGGGRRLLRSAYGIGEGWTAPVQKVKEISSTKWMVPLQMDTVNDTIKDIIQKLIFGNIRILK